MAEVKKARLFLRRGTDTDRQTTPLCQGELGYSTDAFRVFVGDGSTNGGKTLGNYLYVSGGNKSPNFHTNLTTASANGRAHKGDIAVFPAQAYKKANGVTTVTPHASASTVMILTADVTATGSEAANASSWVAVNSGIPFGNIDVFDDDITGNYVSGGTISGPITLSGGQVNIGGDGTSETLILSGVALSAQLGASDKTAFEGNVNKVYPVGITGTSQLTALSSSYEFENSGKDDATSNYYYDYLSTTAAGDTNANALAAAIATSPINAAPQGSLLFIRNKGSRTYGTGNGSSTVSITFVAQFMLVGTDPTTASDWRMVSQVYGQNVLVRGTAGNSSYNLV